METATAEVPRAPTLLPLGDAAWTVEFGERIDAVLHARVLGLAAALEAVRSAGDDAALWAAIDEPMVRRLATAAIRASGCVVTNDMTLLVQSSTLWASHREAGRTALWAHHRR